MLFKRKNKPPKNTDSIEFKRWIANKINGMKVRYVLERGEDGVEIIIGKSGFINFNRDELEVICGEKILFKAKVDTLNAWEFMSLEGVTLTGFDLIQSRERTVLAYYKYHRK